MSETERPGDGERVRQEALDWLRRLTSGEASRADLDALDRWRAQSPQHRRALAEANLLWGVLGRVAQEAGARDAVRAAGRLTGHRVGRRALLAGAAAAAGFAYLAVRPPFHLWPAVAELMADYRAATGERRQLAIAAGITVELDTQTSLTAPVPAGPLYSLELIAGQLAVTIQAAAARPVVIAAAGGQARAEQARFNLRRDGASVSVTCAEGAVQVAYRSMTATLGTGQQVTYGEHGLGAAVASDPAVATAWQRGLLIFRDAPLAAVVDEVNRYRPGRIILLNEALAARKVVAGFQLDRIDEVVDYLTRAFGAKARQLPGGVVLLS
jgi:transmembrane sensor